MPYLKPFSLPSTAATTTLAAVMALSSQAYADNFTLFAPSSPQTVISAGPANWQLNDALFKIKTNDSITVPFTDANAVFKVEKTQLSVDGRTLSLSGIIDDNANPSVLTLIVNEQDGDALIGVLKTAQHHFRIAQTAEGIIVTDLLNATGRKAVPIDHGGVLIPNRPETTETPVPTSEMEVDGKAIIDVMVIWDKALETRLGGVDAVKNKIQQRIAETNQAFIDSEVDAEVRFVYGERKDYSSQEDNIDALEDIQARVGVFSDIKDLREEHGADLVGFLRDFNEYQTSAGIAFRLGDNGQMDSIDKDYAFFVVSDGEYQCGRSICYSPDSTFPHELGHNLGADHDHSHSNVTPIFSYAFGHDNPGVFATIMSYDDPIVMKYSNPDLLCNGEPCGIPEGEEGEADNARTFNFTAFKVNNFYPAKYPYVAEDSPLDTTLTTVLREDGSGGSQGDGDGKFENGETLAIYASLTNETQSTASGLTGELSVTDSCATLVEDQTTWQDIAAGDSQLAENPLTIQLNNCADQQEINLNLLVDSNNGDQLHSFTFVVSDKQDADYTVIQQGGTVVAESTTAQTVAVTDGSFEVVLNADDDLVISYSTSVLQYRVLVESENIVTTLMDNGALELDYSVAGIDYHFAVSSTGLLSSAQNLTLPKSVADTVPEYRFTSTSIQLRSVLDAPMQF